MSRATKNHYETLQVNENASQEVIEKMFRFLASQFHPDAGGDKDEFNRLVEAFDVLRDPACRASYDLKLKQQTNEVAWLQEHSKQAGPDTAIRHELLCLFYARRRQNASTPTLGAVAIEKSLNLPEEVLEFHLWYFREKGWIKRGENGGFAITAEGVDQIHATEMQLSNQLYIETTPESNMKNELAVTG